MTETLSTAASPAPPPDRGWQLRVVHSTGYHYASPATQSYNEARLTPRSDRRQDVLATRIETTPATRAYRYTDYWGTEVTSFDLHAPHIEFTVVATSVVETVEAVPPVREATWKDLRSEPVLDEHDEFLRPTKYTPRDRELATVARRLRKGNDPTDTVLAVAGWVHEQLTYRPGSTGVHSTATDAWRAREGVCQDYAHVTLVMLRAIGIPARYVSGYLHTRPDAALGETVAGESHAWVDVWTGGWWAYDPTNAMLVGPRHVWVATGRDYADVAPLKGIFTGGAGSTLDVSVQLTRLA
ncbi:Transglutaminase-like enzyme, putative cysteine protease [Amycolatopsis arida]|uniref:Transglutaminase-like enzyme, putative cysteine protease n=1 Tax=Amycolatopsis arida TaxID=587909 RepID=A0A1I5TID0_9PSEU|nr:transglutaminase family protein [Amycolatopsis arida]TDX96102.1 transglutaminase-like putative cysteine protease [Amycolatopsis arida]SFP82136.1 Transglutaminase-like enzyme, putative cysteine protease [Amycolatopsis arida]